MQAKTGCDGQFRSSSAVFVMLFAGPEIGSLTVSDIAQTSVTLSWSLGDTQHVDVVQVDQRAINLSSSVETSEHSQGNRRLNASSSTLHNVTLLSPGTTYAFYVQIQSYGSTAKTDAQTITTGASERQQRTVIVKLLSHRLT